MTKTQIEGELKELEGLKEDLSMKYFSDFHAKEFQLY